jgi:RNA polymerase sigma-70 factor (ECF subfamily)
MTPDAAASIFLGGATSDPTSGARVLRLVERAQASWPELALDPSRFVARLRELSSASIDDAEALHVGDLWLATAASLGDAKAIAAFEATVMQPVLERMRGREHVDDVAQLLRAQLLVGESPRILGYAGRAPLERWLGVALSRMLEHARRDASKHGALDDDDGDLAAAADLEHMLLRAEARAALAEALRAAVDELDAEDRALLRLHVSDQLGIDELARLYGVHRATAARRVERARRELGRLTRKSLATQLALPPWEVESLVRIVRSSFRSLVKTYLVG